MEKWLSVPGYEGFYEASSLGRVRSLDQQRGHRMCRGRILKPRPHPSGYSQVRLYIDRIARDHSIHVLICSAFHGPRPAGKEAAHSDGVKSNCRASNLSWKTPKENAEDKRRHGTVVRGEHHGRSKLTPIQVAEIIRSEGKQAEVAIRHGISQPHVHRIRRGQRWSHLPSVG
ncbi:NUMOD4 motif-containing HNH endonuclease [Sphingobium sp. YBL2]|uniref:NUMOD4 motif-containing HNH endonuclease n=1 Tax=Sphingobium sp. (strain YBL2) TaxID=484429 RepID=UPI00155D8F34